MNRPMNRSEYSFEYAVMRLKDRILGTTMTNIAGRVRTNVCLHVEFLTSFCFVFIIKNTSVEACENEKRLVAIVNI